MRIAVVGSGPAGASAGYHLASSGQEVTLIDRAAFPRDKRCGDWVTPGAVEALASLGLGTPELRALARNGARIDGSLLVAPNARCSRAGGGVESYCIPRLVFDDVLRARAMAAGCRFVQRDVRDRDLPELWGDFDRVVDARGAVAGRANSAGMRAYWTLHRGDASDLPISTVQMFADPVYRLGYGWVFPVVANRDIVRFNVGVGAEKVECAPAGRSLPLFFQRFVRQNPDVRRLLERAFERTKPVGFPVALGERYARVAHEGVLRIGDAANLTDPLTGEGIANAIASGRLVAQAIGSSADRNAAVRTWERLYEEAFLPDFRVALRLRRLLTTTPAKNAAMWVLGRTPRLARHFHDALSGTTRYRDLIPIGF